MLEVSSQRFAVVESAINTRSVVVVSTYRRLSDDVVVSLPRPSKYAVVSAKRSRRSVVERRARFGAEVVSKTRLVAVEVSRSMYDVVRGIPAQEVGHDTSNKRIKARPQTSMVVLLQCAVDILQVNTKATEDLPSNFRLLLFLSFNRECQSSSSVLTKTTAVFFVSRVAFRQPKLRTNFSLCFLFFFPFGHEPR